MEFLAATFAVGAFWFWMLILVETVVIFACIENEKGILATLSVVGFFSLLWLLGVFNVFGYMAKNPWKSPLYVGGYFVAGALWSVVKWYVYVINQRSRYDDARANFLENINVKSGSLTDELKIKWETHLEMIRLEVKPQARKHMGKLLTWATYWPWSFLWTFVDDFVKRVFKLILLRLQAVYQSISDYAFKGTENDFLDQDAKEKIASQQRARKVEESGGIVEVVGRPKIKY